jgi:hypothetical protein
LEPLLESAFGRGSGFKNSHGFYVHDAPGSIGAQRGNSAMLVFAIGGLCYGLCGAMDKPGKEPAYSAAFVV